MHNTNRYAKLRPHRERLLKWCLDGLQWIEMAELLKKDHGIEVQPSSIFNACTRHGFTHVHEYSTHFRPDLKRRLQAGTISANDLKNQPHE